MIKKQNMRHLPELVLRAYEKIFRSNGAGIPWFLSLSGLLVFSETPLKAIVLVLLISPLRSQMGLKQIFLIFSRNLIVFTGILWSIHSLLGYFMIESLRHTAIKILIELAAIQIVQFLNSPDCALKEQIIRPNIAKLFFLATVVSLYTYSFFNFPRRLATFLLGWDHLNGHLWLASRIFQEGRIRINSADGMGIYPKAEFPLILSFARASVDFQSLVQSIFFIEVLLSIATLVVLHELTFGRMKSSKLGKRIQICCTFLVFPILIWFSFYGWTSLILTTSSLLLLVWQSSVPRRKYNLLLTLFLSLAAFQSWTLVAPIVVIIFFAGMRKIDTKNILFGCIFFLINIPSILAIVNYNGVEQVSEGFKSKSLLFFLIFACLGVPISFALRYKKIGVHFKLLILSLYIEAILIWATNSFGRELPYYAIKLFLMTLIFFIPLGVYLVIRTLRIERLQLAFLGILLVVLGFGNVPASKYGYLDFLFGKNLETNWLSENIVSQKAKIKTSKVILHSKYVVDLNTIGDVGKNRNQEVFAHDSNYICEIARSKRPVIIISEPMFILPKCN